MMEFEVDMAYLLAYDELPDEVILVDDNGELPSVSYKITLDSKEDADE